MRPDEFYTSGDPRTEQPHQCRLDDLLAIKKVVAVALVARGVKVASDLGQDHQLDVLIFEENRAVTAIRLLVGNSVGERIGIHLAAAALVNALLQKHGVRV